MDDIHSHYNSKLLVGNMTHNTTTKMVDTMGSKIKDTVALVCLGDSRGFVHMNHLILK